MPEAPATLVPLAQIPAEEVEALLDRAFGEDRRSRTAYKVREGSDWLEALSFAASDGAGRLAGTIQAWPVALVDPRGRAHPLLMIGPVAVCPERHNQGFGRALFAALTAALGATATPGTPPLPQMLIGDPEYYARFGFSAEHTARWRLPGPGEPRRLLARAAQPHILPRAGMLGPWRG